MNYFKEFIRYTSLNVLGMLGLSCYILADTFFVSLGLGTNGLAALNLAIPIYSFIHGIGLMIGIGGGTKYSIATSQGDKTAANHIFTNALWLAAILSIILFSLGAFISPALAELLGATGVVFNMSKVYLQVILLFAPFFVFNNLLLCFVRNDGSPQLAMAAMLGGSMSNVVLDYIFIFPLDMGIFGAAFATGLAPIISMLILTPFFLKGQNKFHFKSCKLYSKLASGIVSSGFPSLVTEVSSGIVIIVFNMIILKLQGNIGIAAYGVIANLSLVLMAIYTGIAQGIQPLISHYHGAGNTSNVRCILRYALISMLVVSVVVYTAIFFGAEAITSIFNRDRDPVLQSIATIGLRLYFTACLVAGFNIIISVYFTSTEQERPAHIISLLRGLIVIIPLTILLSSIAGMTGVWLAFPLTELLVAVLGMSMYKWSLRA